MPFKIVRTIENGKYELWIAPSQWESNGVVRWPKTNAQFTNLCKNDQSIPGTDWRKRNCQVKRTNIATYEDAEREISRMLDATDTDDDDPRFKKYTQPRAKEPLNLNSLVEQVMTNEEEHLVNVIPGAFVEPSEIIITGPDTFPNYSLNDSTTFNANTYEALDLKKILDNQNLLLENQKKILELIAQNNQNQEKILHTIASLSIQVDNVILANKQQGIVEVCALEKTKNTADSLLFNLKTINCIQELNKMESLLSDKNTREHLKKSYSIVCSRGKGLDCAYTLIDVLFSREFLCECSWSGSSRNDGIKISLKCFKNVVSFFWEVIFNWDPTFTMKDNEIFFKNILKNANKRKSAKFERASTSRKRAKLEKNKKEEEECNNDKITENQENEINNANIKDNDNSEVAACCRVEKESHSVCVDDELNPIASGPSGDIEIGSGNESDEHSSYLL